ncbi:MAG: PhoH family protein [Lewinellaceae bacterium]|nr:PhoH family protein [Saprospiraceae bacterium]MCB9332538.1 PhoH family protein [Lewinellaceae bacterium]
MSEIILTVEGVDPVELYGENNAKLNLLRKAFPDVTITSRGNSLKLAGDKKFTQPAKAKFEQMVRYLREHNELPAQMVTDLLGGSNPFDVRIPVNGGSNNNTILFGRDGRPIKAKTRNQKLLVEACDSSDIVFAVGPAGTGKTYTAVAIAVRALKNKLVKKIVLTRPAVEAGENLGFLPGDLKEKVDPYLRPLYDALDDMLPMDKLQFFMDNRIIEIAPLAFMRGRTLDNAYIILDEAQNASPLQLKMFLTRLGPNAKCIITGDLSQIDLPGHQKSGLRQSMTILEGVHGISVINLTAEDVVRHRLVKEIIKAYDKIEAEDRARKERIRQEKEAETKAKQDAPGTDSTTTP